MNDQFIVESWATELGTENYGWLGNGDIGHAYEVDVDDGKVIKITNSKEEFICAYYLLDGDYDYLVKVEDIRVYPDGEMVILMEKVDTGDHVEIVFSELMHFMDKHDVDYYSIADCDAYNTLSKEAKKMSHDILEAIDELAASGYGHSMGYDIKGDNMGINSKGNYCLFDQMDKSSHFNFNKQGLFNSIVGEIQERYRICPSKAKPISVDINKVSITEDAAKKELDKIKLGQYQTMDIPIECKIDDCGFIEAVDAARFTQALLLNEETITIKIIHDERSGDYHENYDNENTDKLPVDYDQLFTGLEEIEDFEELDELSSKLHSFINFSQRVMHKEQEAALTV